MLRYEGGDWNVKVSECDLSAPRRSGHMVKERLSIVVTSCKYREAVGTDGERKVAGVSCLSVGVCAHLEG